MTVRAFPAPRHQPPEGWTGPWCRWCGEPILTGRKDRGRHDGRAVLGCAPERDCAHEWALHIHRDVQFAYVAKRDGEHCWDCGEAPMKWRASPVTYIGGEPGRETPAWNAPHMMMVHGTRYVPVERVTALELEHEVALWSVAHLPDDERRPYFGPTNLRLRCPTCHAEKTKAEAGTRAKGNRQMGLRLDVPREPSKMKSGRKLPGKGEGPKMKGRGFDKTHRPLTSRNDLRRR